MRLDQHVGNGDLALEVGACARVPRVLIVADVEPGPAVERALPHPRDVVRHQIVAEAVALVGRAIEIAGRGMNGEADAIADAGGEDAGGSCRRDRTPARRRGRSRRPSWRRADVARSTTAIRPARLPMPSADIAARADRNQHPPVVLAEDDVPGRVPAIAAARRPRFPVCRRPWCRRTYRESERRCRCWRRKPISDCRRSGRTRSRTARRARSAKISLTAGFEPSSAARSTRIRPALVSATKMSPFGATRIWRGPLSPSANSSILKPAGTCGAADGGRGTTRELLEADARRARLRQIRRADQPDDAGPVGAPVAERGVAGQRSGLRRRAGRTWRRVPRSRKSTDASIA